MSSKVKLVMTWDILPGREEDYFEFHIQKFVPALEDMGLDLKEAWLTMYGKESPRRMAEAVIPDINKANDVLSSVKWDDFGDLLDEFVENFDYKIIPARTRWQM